MEHIVQTFGDIYVGGYVLTDEAEGAESSKCADIGFIPGRSYPVRYFMTLLDEPVCQMSLKTGAGECNAHRYILSGGFSPRYRV